MSVASVLSRFSQDIVLNSSTQGYRDENGDWIDGTPIAKTIKAVVQPVNGDELQTVPEGERTNKLIKLHTTEVLKTTDEANAVSADTVIVDGETFRIITVSNWNKLGGFYKAIAVREDG